MEENPVKIAIKMETDGIDFYEKAVEMTNNPLGKKMFLSFIEDEKNHLTALEMVFKGTNPDKLNELFNETPRERIETVFSRAKEEMEQGSLDLGSSEIEAIETAMKLEKDGYDYYIKVSNEAESEDIRDLFNRLALEEDQHYTMLQNTHTYLSDNGNWFLWEERGVIDGG